MIVEPEDVIAAAEPVGDADTNGHLAMAMFVGVIVLMLVVIYAFAIAA